MPGCQRCWWDAELISRSSVEERVDIYHKLIDERDCTPEQQCGDEHFVLEWKDGSHHCVCGAKSEPTDEEGE